MADATAESPMRAHLATFGALIALTLVSVGLTLGGVAGLPVVLGIACIQVALVIRFLLHVWQDGAAIRWLFGFTAFFVALLFAATMLSRGDTLQGTEFLDPVSIGTGHDDSDAETEH